VTKTALFLSPAPPFINTYKWILPALITKLLYIWLAYAARFGGLLFSVYTAGIMLLKRTFNNTDRG
jgi:hypothetical protein